MSHLAALESTANLKAALKAVTGRSPNSALAREIAAALQQGRLFCEAARPAPLEIRPLLLFYGTAAYAKALIAGLNHRSLATLKGSHGLKDISVPGCRVSDLRVRIGDSGTFQEFNDTAAPLNRLNYYESAMPQRMILPAAQSAQLTGLEVSLRDILARIPGLESLYRLTFRQPANTASIVLNPTRQDRDLWELRIDDPELFVNRETLADLVERWRQRHPELRKWRLIYAARAWGKSILMLANVKVPSDEIELLDEEEDGRFVLRNSLVNDESIARLPVDSLLSPLGGSVSGSASLIAACSGRQLSEYALLYLGIFLLSSLVRYRPQTWVHAITRSATATDAADDHALALLESFMFQPAGAIEELVADAFGVR